MAAYAAGYTGSNDGDVNGNHGISDVWVLKLDGGGSCNGEVLGWANGRFKHQRWRTCRSTYSCGNAAVTWPIDIWALKLNSDGTLQWQKCLGGSGYDYGASIQLTGDSGYIVTGYTESNDGDISGNHGVNDAWVVKLGPDDVGIAETDPARFRRLIPSSLVQRSCPRSMNSSFQRLSTPLEERERLRKSGMLGEEEERGAVGRRNVRLELLPSAPAPAPTSVCTSPPSPPRSRGRDWASWPRSAVR